MQGLDPFGGTTIHGSSVATLRRMGILVTPFGNFINGNTALGIFVDLSDTSLVDGDDNTWHGNTFETDSEGDGQGVGCIQSRDLPN